MSDLWLESSERWLGCSGFYGKWNLILELGCFEDWQKCLFYLNVLIKWQCEFLEAIKDENILIKFIDPKLSEDRFFH